MGPSVHVGVLCSTILIATTTATAGRAQSPSSPAAPAETVALPEITVSDQLPAGWAPVDGIVASVSATGSKTDTPLEDIPQSVSVVTRAQMDMQNAQSLGDALRYTPGVTAGASQGDGRYDYISLRGFNATAEGLYRDGLRQMSSQMTTRIEPFGLERVEVLRGPASVLYGQTAPGGLINAITKRPTADRLGRVEVQGGSHDRAQVAFDVGGAATEEARVMVRLTGLARRSETQVDFNDDDRIYVAPALTVRPDDDTSITLLGSYQRDEAGTPSPLPAVGTVLHNDNGRIPLERYSGTPALNTFDRTQYSIGWAAERRLDDTWTLRQNARYDNLSFDQENVYAYTGLIPSGTTVNRMAYRFGVDADLFNLDTQAQADWGTDAVDVTSLVGLDYRYNNEKFYQFNGTAPSLNLYAPDYGQPVPTPSRATADSETDLSQIGLYTQQQITVLEHLSFTLGGRQDWVRSETDDALRGTSSSQNDTAFTWRGGAAWHFDNGITPYAGYSTSFSPTSGTDFNGTAFDPSKAKQWEVGAKYKPDGINSLVTVAWFDLTQTNVLTTDPVHPGFREQTGEVQTTGVEIQGLLDLGNGLNLIGSYTWQDPEVTKSNGLDRGKKPTGIPEHIASAWADYTVQSGLLDGLGLGLGVRYLGQSSGSTDNSLTVPDATLFDAALRYAGDDWQISLNATNLFDHYYMASCSSAANCSAGVGRTVVATLRYTW